MGHEAGSRVAIKVLPDALAQDPARLARFGREAKVLASLNHPNIAQIYGVEERALVMELVPGETLGALLRRGPLPLAVALVYAKQIAEALKTAHEKGIIHRDLKPANVMVTQAGVIKVLDFGLAAVTEATTGAGGHPGDSPTFTMATQSGAIFGTASYMSPEQASGQAVDKRADIWAFGVVLWEMLTGKHLFEGDTVPHILAAVLTKQPDLDRIPFRARRLLGSCLERDPRHRLQDVGDAELFLRDSDGPSSIPRNGLWKWTTVGTSLFLISALSAIWHFTRPAERPLIRFDVELGTDLDPRGRVVIAPDGSRIAFVAWDQNRKSYLMTRRLDQERANILDGNLGASGQNLPFFSPDGKWVGYGGDHKLKKVSVEGGLPIVLAEGAVGGGASTWGDNGEIVSALSIFGLSRVSSAGGPTRAIPGTKGYTSFLLPGSKTILISGGQLFLLPIGGGKEQVIPGIRGEWAQYSPIGCILYVDDHATLQALPFDVSRQEAKGAAFPLLEDVESFDLSATGTILCRRGKPSTRTLQWIDESGKTETILKAPGSYGSPRISPDGKQIALTIKENKSRQIWIYDLGRRRMTRLTFENSNHMNPLWMPGSASLIFRGSDGIYTIATDGSGKPRRLLEIDGYPDSISPDGRTLALSRNAEGTQRDIWLVPIEGTGSALQLGRPEPFINGPPDELNSSFSPDGQWIAYSSDLTGAYNVYVCSLKNPAARWQISTEEGYLPQWSSNQKQIVFQSIGDDGLWSVLYSVTGDTFVPGAVRPFGGNVQYTDERAFQTYSLSPTDNRIAALFPASAAEEVRTRPHYVLILNFFEEIKRRRAQAGAH